MKTFFGLFLLIVGLLALAVAVPWVIIIYLIVGGWILLAS